MAVRGLRQEIAFPQRTPLALSTAVLLLTLLGLLLRSLRLDFQPLWWDEGYSVWFAHHPLGEMARLTALDIHPPFYYALLSGWSRLFGETPVALRLLSVVVGTLTVPLIYWTGRSLAGPRVGLLAALLLAISPFHIFYSQEVRMYALAMALGLVAMRQALRWLGLDRPSEVGGSRPVGPLAGYVLSMTLALYTLYYAGLLAASLALAGLWAIWKTQSRDRPAALRRLVMWLGAQLAVVLLILPWLLYAAPRLIPYVSQKVVADSDRPLTPIIYLARHLAAFIQGHLEGPLSSWWWPAGLLFVLLLAWTVARGSKAFSPAMKFLWITGALVLALGWLVNLGFPFFPQRGERLLLIALPIFLLLVAGVVGEALPVTGNKAAPASRPAWLLLGAFVLPGAISLAAFFQVPRYEADDYRALIGQVNQWGRPQDTVFCVFPWQVGYFWSYGQPAGPQPLLSPDQNWSPAVADALDSALARGHLWFPEHLALGGLLESASEEYLSDRAYSLANRWTSATTRLTGWAVGQASTVDLAPRAFSQDVVLEQVGLGPLSLTADNQALLIDLRWQPSAALQGGHAVSLRLADAAGNTWALQDFELTQSKGRDQVALLVPAGTPPGSYLLYLGVRPGQAVDPLDFLGPDGRSQGREAFLGPVQVTLPDPPPAIMNLPMEERLNIEMGDFAALLGYSATQGTLAPGDDLLVNLFWQRHAESTSVDGGSAGPWSAFVQLVDQQDRLAAAWEGPPVAWHPTTSWQQGELVRSQHRLRLPATLNDGTYRLIAGLFDPASGQRLAVTPGRAGHIGDDFASLGTRQVVGRPHLMVEPPIENPLPANLARLGRLIGYDLSTTGLAPGEVLDLTLYWQATGTTNERLVVFVHLLDEAGQFLGQSDGEPGDGLLPTSSWILGEILIDSHRLTVRPDAAAGQAFLSIGLYNPDTAQRVPWQDPAGDTLRLPVPLTVKLPQ